MSHIIDIPISASKPLNKSSSNISSSEEVNGTHSFVKMATTKKKYCGEEIGGGKCGDDAKYLGARRESRKEDATLDSSGEFQLYRMRVN